MSDVTKAVKEVKLTAEMTAAKDNLIIGMNIDADGNNKIDAKVLEAEFQERSGVDMETLTKIQDTIDFLKAATHIAQVEKAATFFKDNEDVDMVTSKTKLGDATLAIRTHRSREFQVPNADKTVTNYCQTSVIYDDPRKYARVAKNYGLEYAKSILAD